VNEDATVADPDPDPDAARAEAAAAGPPAAGQVAIVAGTRDSHFIASKPPAHTAERSRRRPRTRAAMTSGGVLDGTLTRGCRTSTDPLAGLC
jgi:hypothetical protein